VDAVGNLLGERQSTGWKPVTLIQTLHCFVENCLGIRP